MTDDQLDVIRVEILGQMYPIRSQLDPSYVSSLASYVHEKMQTAAGHAAGGDSVRVAVLAALNIADEYFRYRDGRVTDERSVRERTLEIEAAVDGAIARTPTDPD